MVKQKNFLTFTQQVTSLNNKNISPEPPLMNLLPYINLMLNYEKYF